MLAIINSCAFLGMEGVLIKVEVDINQGLPAFEIVGLPDASVRESKERVRSAIINSGFDFPLRRITVNLAPADFKKEGPLFDLAIAIGILTATNQVPRSEILLSAAICGELSLDGAVRNINGVLPMADRLSQEKEIEYFFLPRENALEAAIIQGIKIAAVTNLKDFVELLVEEKEPLLTTADLETMFHINSEDKYYDMADVRGQESAKRAMEIAASGAHNIILMGSPGSGKTMLARRMPSILPILTLAESMEVTKVYSIAGMLPKNRALIVERPFRSPHHGASSASICGGGANPKPGEISLAHNGVLFLDEMPEFHRDVLEALRQPLEDHIVCISRVASRLEFPANFQLVGALNPCPCGYLGDSEKMCNCTPNMVKRYLSKISGPLLDRVDLHIEVPRVKYADLAAETKTESSAVIRARVMQVRAIQYARFQDNGKTTNAAMSPHQLRQYCVLSAEGQNLMKGIFNSLHLSARAHDRILKVARTIADMDGCEHIEVQHLAEAVQYRALDRTFF